MEYYSSSSSAIPETNYRRIGIFVGIIVMHGLLFWALQSGLAKTLVNKVMGPIVATNIEEIKPEEEEPPPPPPKFQAPPPVFVDMPDVAITETAPVTNTITTSNERPKVAPPPPKEDVIIPPRSNPRRPNAGPEEMYPAMSKRLGEEGAVILLLTVDEEGKVTDATVQTSSGFERLDDAAVKEAKRSWRFLPGTKNGKPASMQMPYKVTFKITK